MDVRKTLSCALASAVLLSSAGISAFAAGADIWDGSAEQDWYGDGTASSYALSSGADLAGLAALVNSGVTFEGKTITLETDIDLDGREWTQIGKNGAVFSGTFDGQSHTIDNLTINTPNVDYCGFFYQLSGATVEDLHISGADITSSGWTGVLAGRADSAAITGCTVSGTLTAGGTEGIAAAGLVEYVNQSTISDCSSAVEIDARSPETGITYAGGIACEVNGSVISDCINTGVITAESSSGQDYYTYAGGIAAYVKNGASVTGCINEASISAGGSDTYYAVAGGILGQIWVENPSTITVTGCTNTGTVTAAAAASGWACNAGKIGETYVYDGDGKKINTLVLDEIQDGDIGRAQQDEAVAHLIKSNGDIYGYASLEESLQAAQPGDTVEVIQQGAYDGNYTIDKAITLEGMDGAVFTGVITVSAEGACLDNIKMSYEGPARYEGDPGLYGRLCVTANNVSIKNCDFYAKYDEMYPGLGVVWIPDRTGVTVDSCTFETNVMGIFYAMISGSVTNCTFTPIDKENAQPAINYTKMAGVTISGNKFYDGMQIWVNGSDIKVTENEFYGFTYEAVGGNDDAVIDLSRNYWGSETPDFDVLLGDNQTIENYYSDAEKTTLVPAAENVISAYAADAVKETDGTGTIRFITKVDKLTGTPASFGTYILPLSVFETNKNWDLKAVVSYEKPIKEGDTYAADLTGVPAKLLDEPIMAQSFMTIDGGSQNAVICDFDSISVNEAIH